MSCIDTGAGGPPFFLFPNLKKGAPSLRSLQGRVAITPVLWAIMPSGLHRTYGAHHLHLSPAPAIADYRFCAPCAGATDFLRFWNRPASDITLWSWETWSCQNTFIFSSPNQRSEVHPL